MKEVKISTEFIKLSQLLKFADIVSQGSDAKYYINEGMVKVNGETAFERGKKIRSGDIVSVEGFEEVKVSSKGE